MNELLRPLIKNSYLELIEYNCHIRTEMEQRNRTLNHYVLSYLKRGEALLRMYGQDYVIKPGEAILIPPNVVHDHIKTSEEDAEFLWWHFNYKSRFDVDVLSFLNLRIKVKLEDPKSFEKLFEEFLGLNSKDSGITEMVYQSAKAMVLFANVLDDFLYANEKKDANATLRISTEFFEIFNEIAKDPRADMTLSAIAKKYHMNPNYISNKFKKYLGMPFMQLQRKMVIEKAKDYLLSTRYTVSEISYLLGFSEPTVFTRLFTEKVGASPSKFRNEA
jgi:AraC-like DNA-binding protein